MNRASFRRWGLLALPLLVVPVAACSSGPTTSAPADPAAASRPDSEDARIQQFVDARYLRSDVRDTFRTPAGQDIDCVDFFAEPGVKAMAAQGKPITELPKPPPLPEALRKKRAAERGAAEDLFSFHGQPDVNGKPQQCPDGTVPEVRITADEIRAAGGLDAYVHARMPKAPPPRVTGEPGGSFTCDPSQEYANYAHVVGTLVNGDHDLGYGDSTMAVYGPTVPSSAIGDHSLSQIWLYSGANTSVAGGTCTSNCVQSIEIGWDVDNSINYLDRSTPHIFLFSTSNGYGNGCYDNVPNLPSACVPWIPDPTAKYALNQALAFAAPGTTPPTELETTVLLSGTDYWLIVSVTGGPSSYIGHFPGSDFSAPMNTFQVGGEVASNSGQFMNTGLAMGSGNPPDQGYGKAAYHRDYAAVWVENGQNEWAFDAALCAMRPGDYGYSTTAPKGVSTWGDYFYYGGNPTCTVTTCQARGATCGTIDNGCGTPLSCGSCPAGDSCIGNTCVCTPRTCRSGWYWNSDDCACEIVQKCHGLCQ